jgi:uncharacterized protein (TIGR04255 family)
MGIMTWVMTSPAIIDRTLEPLARSPLRLALAQARLLPTPALEHLDTVAQIVDSLPGWELQTRHTTRETQVIVNERGVHESIGPPETVSVLHAAGDEGLRAALSASSVAVECDRYTAWPRMHTAISDVFAACAPHISGDWQRIGVRYVNEITDPRAGGDPAGLAQLLTPALIATPSALDRRVLGSVQELRVAEDPGELVLRHGLIRTGTYLLDLDRFSTDAQSFDAATLAALAEQFHRRIENVFAWALHEDYLTELSQPQEGSP